MERIPQMSWLTEGGVKLSLNSPCPYKVHTNSEGLLLVQISTGRMEGLKENSGSQGGSLGLIINI